MKGKIRKWHLFNEESSNQKISGVEETKIDQSSEGIVVATSILDTKIDVCVYFKEVRCETTNTMFFHP